MAQIDDLRSQIRPLAEIKGITAALIYLAATDRVAAKRRSKSELKYLFAPLAWHPGELDEKHAFYVNLLDGKSAPAKNVVDECLAVVTSHI